MTSTDIKIGLTSANRPSSRVLKPPGGGHTNLFGEPDVAVNAPRPKYNQQNSSNMNACIGSTDANKKVEQLREEIVQTPPTKSEESDKSASKQNQSNANSAAAAANNGSSRGRVPPGGFSSGGFW